MTEYKWDRHEMFPRLVSYLASHHQKLAFLVAAFPTFLVGGTLYIAKSSNLKTRLEEGEEAIFEEIAEVMQDAFKQGKMLAIYDLASYELTNGTHAMIVRYAKVWIETPIIPEEQSV